MNDITYIPENFLILAKNILLKKILIINQNKYRICDIEFYLYSQEHNDPFAHKLMEEKWISKTPFGKGEALAYGNGQESLIEYKNILYLVLKNDDIFLSISIKGICDINNDKIIDGNNLIKLFDNILPIQNIFNKSNKIYITDENIKIKRIIKSGLRASLTEDNIFKYKNYRFTSEWNKVKNKVIKYTEKIILPPQPETIEDNISDSDDNLLVKKIKNIKQILNNNEISIKNKKYYSNKLELLLNNNPHIASYFA